jgi:hypothetical protein
MLLFKYTVNLFYDKLPEMKVKLTIALLLMHFLGNGQELFTATEPASNRPARSIGFRIDHSLMDEIGTSRINYHLIPEVMIGVYNKLSVHGGLFFSNRSDRLRYEGATLYAKYRFLSIDQLQRHFRMAAFVRTSTNNSDIHQQELNVYGHNTGVEAGIVATQLLKKVAISSSASYLRVTDNGKENKFSYDRKEQQAINYSLSFGKLMLPRTYSNYRQLNVNLMLEFLSQVNTGSGNYFIDAAPTVQFIVNSQSKIDISFRKQLTSTMLRTAPNGIVLRIEHTLFNVL